MKRQGLRTHFLRGEAQRLAASSPLRLEIIGQFIDDRPLSVREIAERMGRPPSAIHYHVRLLEKSGLLKKTGERREGRRREAEYEPVADVITVAAKAGRGETPENKLARKIMASALRMSERDFKAALRDPRTRKSGPDRNMFTARLHCRLRRKDLEKLNRGLDAIMKTLTQVHQRHAPAEDDEFVSLTLALLPLPDRKAGPHNAVD